MYEFGSRVRYSEVSEEGTLKLEALVDYFQDVSTFQSEDLGLGVEYLTHFGMAWVLSYWQIQVNRYPKLGEEIVAATFPYEFKGFMGLRNFLLKTKEGEVLACANSVWTLIDIDKVLPVKAVPEVMMERYVLEEKYSMEYAGRKVAIPKEGESLTPFAITRRNLDTNHHVNNGQYVRMAKEYIPEQMKIAQLRVEYKKSAKLGDVICPFVYQSDAAATVCLNDEMGKPFAVVEFTYNQ